ncbi:hypothetical protein KFE25_010984 [Diacronema lutheri]|uniref:ATP-grasp domain-containing protein n=1 Tax=Diacronema lutheri TaxID=2081491 RepID=A0A8J6C7M4_DIALT|nr:hypothetical protein KFE25_010984 [Diacronema lutheri]
MDPQVERLLPPAVVVVDPMSTGARISADAADRGFTIVRLWSSDCPPELRSHTSSSSRDVFAATLEHTGGYAIEALEATARALRALPVRINAILCGSEPGVNLTDALSEHMRMRGNGTALAHVRRNKFNQSEAVRGAGVRAVKQALVSSVEEAAAFLPHLTQPAGAFRAIVKPVESAGSEDVKLCESAAEVFEHARRVLGTTNALGQRNASVLVQEFLVGAEYIVDCVSRDGDHKCVAVWLYDKRAANGAPFVYFGQRPLDVSAPGVPELIAYTLRVLDALGIRNGATHSEVIVDGTGSACLVECNCRAHGGNAEWVPVIEPLVGYSQVSALLDAFLRPDAFAALPAAPQPFRSGGMLAFLPSYKDGVLLAAPGIERVAKLRSCVRAALEQHVGKRVVRTVNVFTELGIALLVSPDRALVEADYARVHELCADAQFVIVEGDAPEVERAGAPKPAAGAAGMAADEPIALAAY